jgi:hypothetical protein
MNYMKTSVRLQNLWHFKVWRISVEPYLYGYYRFCYFAKAILEIFSA